MNPTHAEIIEAISNCRMLPGSFDKRIVKLWSLKVRFGEPMTEKGIALLYQLLHNDDTLLIRQLILSKENIRVRGVTLIRKYRGSKLYYKHFATKKESLFRIARIVSEFDAGQKKSPGADTLAYSSQVKQRLQHGFSHFFRTMRLPDFSRCRRNEKLRIMDSHVLINPEWRFWECGGLKIFNKIGKLLFCIHNTNIHYLSRKSYAEVNIKVQPPGGTVRGGSGS